MIPSYVPVLPLLTAVSAFAGFLLDLALLAKEHHARPCLQKAGTGLILVALMFAADAGPAASAARLAADPVRDRCRRRPGLPTRRHEASAQAPLAIRRS